MQTAANENAGYAAPYDGANSGSLSDSLAMFVNGGFLHCSYPDPSNQQLELKSDSKPQRQKAERRLF